MKYFYTTIFLIAMHYNLSAQEIQIKNLKNRSDIEYTEVTKKMFDMMSSVKHQENDQAFKTYQNFLKDLTHMDVFMGKNALASQSVLTELHTIIKDRNLQLSDASYQMGDGFKIYTLNSTDAGKVKEMVLISNHEQNKTGVYLTGNFSMEQFHYLAKKLNLLK